MLPPLFGDFHENSGGPKKGGPKKGLKRGAPFVGEKPLSLEGG